MKRYLRILRLFWSAALAAEMEYRINFLVAALTSIVGLAGSIFALTLFYSKAGTLNGWTWAQALVVMGLFTILEGFSSTCLSPNLSRIVQHVQQGTLDFVLLKPVDSQFWLSTRNFSPWGLPNVLFGLAILIFAGRRIGATPMDYLIALLPVLCGLTILYSIWFVIGATSVWFVKVWNATEVLRSYLEAGRYPVAFYPAAFRVFFTFIIPVAFLTTVPAESFLGHPRPRPLLAAVSLAAALFTTARLFWHFALRYYTSASS